MNHSNGIVGKTAPWHSTDLLIKLARTIDPVISKLFRGTYTSTNVDLAVQFIDDNTWNIIFVQIASDQHWMAIIDDIQSLHIVDTPENIEQYPSELTDFLHDANSSSANNQHPDTLTFDVVDYRKSEDTLSLALYMCYQLTARNTDANPISISDVVQRSAFKPKHATHNLNIVKQWMVKRYSKFNLTELSATDSQPIYNEFHY
jgi:hypothetical protein